MQSDEMGLVARLKKAAKPIKVFAGVSSRGAVYRTDKPLHAALLTEAAKALASKDAAIERLVAELARLHNGEDAILPHTKRHAEHLYIVATAAMKSYGVDVETALARAEAERDEAMEALKLADAAIDLGLDLISDRKGWGKYQRMEGVEIYEDADRFEKAAEAYRARQALGDT